MVEGEREREKDEPGSSAHRVAGMRKPSNFVLLAKLGFLMDLNLRQRCQTQVDRCSPSIVQAQSGGYPRHVKQDDVASVGPEKARTDKWFYSKLWFMNQELSKCQHL